MGVDFVASLPREALQRVGAELVAREGGRASCVSRSWRDALADDDLWREWFDKAFGVKDDDARADGTWRATYVERLRERKAQHRGLGARQAMVRHVLTGAGTQPSQSLELAGASYFGAASGL